MTQSEHGPAGSHSPLVHFDVQEQSGVRTVRARGEIDVSNVAELRGATINLSNEALGMVLDVDQAEYIDSATIRVLYELRRRLARRGQILLVVSHPSSSVHRVLDLAGFLNDNDPHPGTSAEAAAAIRARLGTGPARRG
jgi:anti-anti-sigma factor